MQKSSTFIIEFTVIDTVNEWECVGSRYIYRESSLFEPGYYIEKDTKTLKSLFYLIMRPQNYKITKLAQNNTTINIQYLTSNI